MSFKKAVKEQVKLRLGLCGLAGTGKTFSALAIADAMAKLIRSSGHGAGRIAVLDTERGSASLYADKFDFDVCELDTFSPLLYVAKIKEAEEAGYDFIVVDSLSHAWMGKDGALDQKDQAAERSSSGNSYMAWRTVTPKHNALVDAMLQSKAHVIATLRTKMEYVQDKNEKGKTEIRKVGLAPIQREGMDYEMTVVGDLDHTHTLKISKTRIDGIDLDDIFEKPGEHFAKKIYTWMMSGAPPRPRATPPSPTAVREDVVANDGTVIETASPVLSELDRLFAEYLGAIAEAPNLVELDRIATSPRKPEKGTEQHRLAVAAYLARKEWLQKQAAESKAS